MKTKIYVTQVDRSATNGVITPTGYFLTADEAKDQMLYDWQHLTARERKSSKLYAEIYEIEHEEPLTTQRDIENALSDWSDEQFYPNPIEYIELDEVELWG